MKNSLKMMMNKHQLELFNGFYLFGSQIATHIGFWLIYYVTFSLIWMKSETGYYASFYLEFILLPARIMAVYIMIYVLIPKYLVHKKYSVFLFGYIILLLIAGLIHRLSSFFFYEQLVLDLNVVMIEPSSVIRAILLINSTVVFVAAIKLFQMYTQLKEKQSSEKIIALVANRRTHFVNACDIEYIEGMGNYVHYHLVGNKKLTVYQTIKMALAELPDNFVRLHRSFIINIMKVNSYNQDNVLIGENLIPRGKDITDEMFSKRN